MRVSLFLNHACNLACRYCYNGEHFSRAMPWDVAKAGVELALAQPGSKHRVSFFGGEPLLEMALIRRVMDYCAQRKDETGIDLYHLVVSNAVLLDEEKLGYFLDNDVYVAVSVDGCRQAHEATRCFADGSSSYDRVRANATRLFAERPGNKVIAVIDPLNVDWLGDSFDALLAMGARNLSMNVNYEGRWEEPERARFERALRQLGDRYIAAYRRGAAFTLNMLDSKIVTHLKLGYADGDRCDFGCEEVAVSPRGRLYPCDRLVGMDDQDDIVIGDVFEGIDPQRRDALIAEKNKVMDDCADCAVVHRCMHWCGCVNHAMTGSVGGVAGLLCWFEQRMIEEADRVASILFQEENPGFIRRFYAPRVRNPPAG
jgi:uncharacterized protein